MKIKGITIKRQNNCKTWYARYRDNGKQYFISGKTQKEVEEKLRQALAVKNEKKKKQDFKNQNTQEVVINEEFKSCMENINLQRPISKEELQIYCDLLQKYDLSVLDTISNAVEWLQNVKKIDNPTITQIYNTLLFDYSNFNPNLHERIESVKNFYKTKNKKKYLTDIRLKIIEILPKLSYDMSVQVYNYLLYIIDLKNAGYQNFDF